MKQAFRAIFSGFDEDFHLDVIKSLVKEHHWEPVYMIGNRKNKALINQTYPDTIFHTDFDAFRGAVPEDLKDLVPEPLDRDLLEKLSFHHHIAITMMDRMDPGGYFDYRERMELFNRLAGYWLTILEKHRPEVVVFHLTPHLVYDYILYVLCGIKGIRTLIFNSTSVNDLVYLCERFNDKTPIMSAYQDLLTSDYHGKIGLSRSINEYIKKIRGDYHEGLPFYSKSNALKEKEISDPYSDSGGIKKVVRSLKRACEDISGDKKPLRATYLKRQGRHVTDSAWTVGEYRTYKKGAKKAKQYLRAYYDQIARKPDYSKQYVYAPLQYQPEKTTSPEAGLFVDQYLMIDMLSKSIPADWVIYVKEHPTQFYETWHGERSSKNRSFYEKLLSLPNVSLIDLNTASFDMIDSSIACCTTTGTAGWESVLRGKPVLLFGYPWYRGCESVFEIRTREDCSKAVDLIASGYKIDQEKVELFLMAMEKVCFKGYIYGRMKEATDVPYTENVKRIVNTMVTFTETGHNNQ